MQVTYRGVVYDAESSTIIEFQRLERETPELAQFDAAALVAVVNDAACYGRQVTQEANAWVKVTAADGSVSYSRFETPQAKSSA